MVGRIRTAAGGLQEKERDMNLSITHRIGILAAATVLGAFLAPVAGASSKDGRSPDTKDAATLAHAQVVPPADGRSADTKDAAFVAQSTVTGLDLRSPDTKEAAATAHATRSGVDLRSPDTRDAAVAAHAAPAPSVVVVGDSGFDWVDAGIGAGGGIAIALLAAGALVLLRSSRGKLAL
jgi:hypothetical protein